MTSLMIDILEHRIENALELSSICRGEWCRSLESNIDVLESLVNKAEREAHPVDGLRLSVMANKLTTAYRNLGPDIHV